MGKIIGFHPTNQNTLYLLPLFYSDNKFINLHSRLSICSLIGWVNSSRISCSLSRFCDKTDEGYIRFSKTYITHIGLTNFYYWRFKSFIFVRNLHIFNEHYTYYLTHNNKTYLKISNSDCLLSVIWKDYLVCTSVIWPK